MSSSHQRTIEVLQILLKIENIEIIKCTIESLIEELQDLQNKKKEWNKDKE